MLTIHIQNLTLEVMAYFAIRNACANFFDKFSTGIKWAYCFDLFIKDTLNYFS